MEEHQTSAINERKYYECHRSFETEICQLIVIRNNLRIFLSVLLFA